jgi:hypothetical protein
VRCKSHRAGSIGRTGKLRRLSHYHLLAVSVKDFELGSGSWKRKIPSNMYKVVWLGVIITAMLSRTMAMPIPQDVKQVVGFVFVADSSGKLKPQGTGFFVVVKDAVADRSHGYFVTAKHVLQTDDQKAFRPEVFVRLNTINNGDAETVKLPLSAEGKTKNVFIHDDPTVDIAVVPTLPDVKHFQFKAVQDQLLTNI